MNPISQKLISWYRKNKRDLPWRDTKDPYKIWLSEIILQQTRVEQGKPYYYKFTEQYPTVSHLAQAPLDEVLKTWQGLGYYSRARNMHVAAQEIMTKYNGKFPMNYADIRNLKGVGDYTAAAIASFSYGLSYAVVDGNVYRVLSRLYHINTPIDSHIGKKQFAELAQNILSAKDPANHNQAIMELGATVCKPQNPDCQNCPLVDHCVAFQKGDIASYPVKGKSKAVQNRYFNYIYLTDGENLCLQQRGTEDIWKGLYDLPMVESTQLFSMEELMEDAYYIDLQGRQKLIYQGHKDYLHKLTHRNIFARYHIFFYKKLARLNKLGIFETTFENLKSYAIPRLLDRFLEEQSNSKH